VKESEILTSRLVQFKVDKPLDLNHVSFNSAPVTAAATAINTEASTEDQDLDSDLRSIESIYISDTDESDVHSDRDTDDEHYDT